MGIRDQEINRILAYCKANGIIVRWKKHRRGDPSAMWDQDENVLTMFTWPGKSKTEIVLDFVHELAHHLSWLDADKKTSRTLEEAIAADSAGTATKKHHRALYSMEIKDSRQQYRIYKHLSLLVPIYKMIAHKYLALWVYRSVWLYGAIPTERAIGIKRRHLYDLWRG